MSEFIYPIDIQSHNKAPAYFREFTNKYFKNFVKVLINEDKSVYEIFVDKCLKDLCYSDIDTSLLTCVDKFYIFVCLRAYNIGQTLELVTENKEGTNVNFELDMNNIVVPLEEANIEYNFTFTDGTVTVDCSLPKKLFFNDVYDMFKDCINTIKFKDDVINFREVPEKDKNKIMSALPSVIMTELLTKLQQQDKILQQITLINFDTDQELNTQKEISISFFNHSIPELIKLIFNTNLKDFYVNEYHLIRRFKFSYDFINQVTPAELNVYQNIIAADVKREQDDQAKQDQQQQQQQQGSAPLPSGS